jgi:hypothetical protein
MAWLLGSNALGGYDGASRLVTSRGKLFSCPAQHERRVPGDASLPKAGFAELGGWLAPGKVDSVIQYKPEQLARQPDVDVHIAEAEVEWHEPAASS